MTQFEEACGTSRPTANATRDHLESLGLITIHEGRLRGLFRDKLISLTPLGAGVAAQLDAADQGIKSTTALTPQLGSADSAANHVTEEHKRMLRAIGGAPIEVAVLFQRLHLETTRGRRLLAELEKLGNIKRVYSQGEDGFGTVLVTTTAAGLNAATTGGSSAHDVVRQRRETRSEKG